MSNFLIFLNLYLFVILWQNPKHSECKHSFILCNWEIMEKVTQLGSQDFSLPIVCIRSLCFPSLFNDTSELIHSFQSSSLISLKPNLSWWPYPFFHQKVETSSGNVLSFPSPNWHGDLYLYHAQPVFSVPCSFFTAKLLKQIFVYALISLTVT